MLREATIDDIPQLQEVRHSVKENILTDPGRVTNEDYARYLSQRGKGWVYEINEKVAGFAVVDLEDNNIWALFIRPEYEGQGIGKKLHRHMLDWYFSKGKKMIWLGTEPGTRAAEFYKRQGWKENGVNGEDEIKFELTAGEWKSSGEPSRE